MRLSVTNQLHNLVAFIGSLQGFEARSHGARVLRNHLSVSLGLAFVSCRVDLIHLVNLILLFQPKKLNTRYKRPTYRTHE
jgi:hypothetical protein